jgi:alpha-glucosidase
VVITDPHVQAKAGTEPFESGLRGDHFVLDPSGAGRGASPRPFIGKAWPGDCAFPEFTLARTRAWWGELYRPYVAAGVAGFWDDMNEPALFDVRKSMPEEVRHRLEGGGSADHVAIHDVYGLLQARATQEGVLALRPEARPFVLTRAGAAGSQRWAATWTGDNRADREGLALSIPTLLGLGTSGWAFAGADVGGFEGCPDPRLLTEWMELGALQPFFRHHSSKTACRREPWLDGPEELFRRRAAVARRQRLLPFLYTLFEESSRTGLPVMRPLWLEHPEDPSPWENDRAFLLGRDLLVAPRLVERDLPYSVALPAGEWFDVASGERAEGGRIEVSAPAGDSLRVYARAGAIVPEGPAALRASDPPEGELTLEVWPGPDCRGELYLDAGEGFGYRRGELRRVSYTCAPSPDGISVTATSAGPFPTWWTATQVVVHGVPRAPTASAGAADVRYDAARQAATATVPGGGAELSVGLRW